MKKSVFILLVIAFSANNLFGQESVGSNLYFERLQDSLIRFYLDQNYFLTDKNCEFKSIERVAGFRRETNRFHGDFTDFDTYGQVILKGHYVDGQKEGRFTAYHPNNRIKWEVTFANNQPIGHWNYYYPDGKPMLSVSHEEPTPKIVSMWDRRGRLQVRNGSGRYEFRNPIDGFSEYGFTFYRTKGRLRDGQPVGLWNIYYENDEMSEAYQVAEEFYRNGKLEEGYHFFKDTEYKDTAFFILPYDNFYRAEALLSKECNFDEFSGFTLFLSASFNAYFARLHFPNEKTADFSYSIKIKDDGTPDGKPTFSKSLSKPIQEILERVLVEIDFYVPSFKGGEYIADTLTISGETVIGPEGEVDFHRVKIEREKESE